MYFLPEDNDYFYEIDTINRSAYGRKIVLEGVELEKYRKLRIENDIRIKGFVMERENETIDDFIKIISNP